MTLPSSTHLLRTLIGVTLVLGIVVRFWNLDHHFSHVDDLGVTRTLLQFQSEPHYIRANLLLDLQMAERRGLIGTLEALDSVNLLDPALAFANKLKRIHRFGRNWTYAPAQFLLTDSLVSPEHTYRQSLFWGRLPSFLCSALALAIFAFFFHRYDPGNLPGMLTALVVVALSWEAIIYAQQQSSYGIAVFCCAVLLLLLVQNVRQPSVDLRSLLTTAFVLGLLCFAQYQVLFLIPAFFLASFLHFSGPRPTARVLASYASAATLVLLLFVPLYFEFLGLHQSAGITWNAGPERQFEFIAAEMGLIDAVVFFVANIWIVVTAMLAPIPESSPLSLPLGALFFSLFCLGAVALARTRDPTKKTMLVFLRWVAITWVLLVILQKLTLSPTRHSLILLPLFAIVVAEGLTFGAEQCRRFLGRHTNPRMRHGAAIIFCLLTMALFLGHARTVIDSRKDPFDETHILAILSEQNVDTLIGADWTLHPSVMAAPWNGGVNYQGVYYYYQHEIGSKAQTIAWLSHRSPLNESSFATARRQFAHVGLTTLESLSSYRIVHREERPSDVEVDFSSRTRNGSNGFYFYILTPR